MLLTLASQPLCECPWLNTRATATLTVPTCWALEQLQLCVSAFWTPALCCAKGICTPDISSWLLHRCLCIRRWYHWHYNCICKLDPAPGGSPGHDCSGGRQKHHKDSSSLCHWRPNSSCLCCRHIQPWLPGMPAILSDAHITAQRLLLPAPWSQTVISHPTGASDPSVDKGLLSTETSL